MTETKGVDTIGLPRTTPPEVVGVSHDAMRIANGLRSIWSNFHLAFIPYCFICKVPLVWHTSDKDNILFRCPKCGMKWLKDTEWIGRDKEKKDGKDVCCRLSSKR